jgi:hypothetical protein
MLLYHMVKLASRAQSKRGKYEWWEEIEDLVRSGVGEDDSSHLIDGGLIWLLLPAAPPRQRCMSLSAPPQPFFHCQTFFILAAETGQVSNAYTKYPTASLTSHLAYEQLHVAGGMI